MRKPGTIIVGAITAEDDTLTRARKIMALYQAGFTEPLDPANVLEQVTYDLKELIKQGK